MDDALVKEKTHHSTSLLNTVATLLWRNYYRMNSTILEFQGGNIK